MVFTLNTTVFAEEVAVDSVDDAVEATVDAVDEVAEEATVDSTDDAVAATDSIYEDEGIKYPVKDSVIDYDHPLTTITYDSNGDKKKEKFDVATITNTTDPTSWNNINDGYAAELIATVLYGGKGEDQWLNNETKITVSKNDPRANVDGLHAGYTGDVYEVIPVVEGSEYIFVGYSLGATDFVVGHDEVVKSKAGGYTYPKQIPVTEWDGRMIDYNKSGDYNYTTGKRERLDVELAFVTYNNGTVKEINGINVGSVKVDKKNQKAASVEAAKTAQSQTYVGYNDETAKVESITRYIAEHKTLSDLPFFTIKANVKGNDAKGYKKAVADKLKDKKFYFGIMQNTVSVILDDTYTDENGVKKSIGTQYKTAIKGSKTTVSEDDIKGLSQNDITKAEESIAELLVGSDNYWDADVEEYPFDTFKATKFTDKGVTLQIVGLVGKAGKYDENVLKTISGKGKNAEYTLESGTLAGESVKYIEFKDGGNFVYTPLDLTITDSKKGTTEKDWATNDMNSNNLAPLGFKWAFRKSPVEKSKKFRYGIFKDDKQGFVYSVDETAVDSVEEAF